MARKGFAAMDPEKQKKIASMGGKAAHASGNAHEWTKETAHEAARKGGLATQAKVRKMRKKVGE
jgi:general stress protein YciG